MSFTPLPLSVIVELDEAPEEDCLPEENVFAQLRIKTVKAYRECTAQAKADWLTEDLPQTTYGV